MSVRGRLFATYALVIVALLGLFEIAGRAWLRGNLEEQMLEDMRRSFVERAPLKRMSTAEDIATLAVYLCSEAAQNLSGQCIAVTAGEPAV